MCAVVGFHAPVLEMPQLWQPPCVLEGQLLGVPACQQESGVAFVTADLPWFVLQTGAHSAGALALASTQRRSTTTSSGEGFKFGGVKRRNSRSFLTETNLIFLSALTGSHTNYSVGTVPPFCAS